MQLSAGTFITTVATSALLTGSCISGATEARPLLNSKVTVAFSGHRQGHRKTSLFFKGLKDTARLAFTYVKEFLFLFLTLCHIATI